MELTKFEITEDDKRQATVYRLLTAWNSVIEEKVMRHEKEHS